MTVVPMFDFNDIQPTATHANERKVYQTRASPGRHGAAQLRHQAHAVQRNRSSRSYPIGGVQGNVSVKKKTRIWLEEGAKQRERHEEPTRQTIAVHGAIGQHFDKQRIRVTCTDPKGRNRIVNVFTDPAKPVRGALRPDDGAVAGIVAQAVEGGARNHQGHLPCPGVDCLGQPGGGSRFERGVRQTLAKKSQGGLFFRFGRPPLIHWTGHERDCHDYQ
ncbi:hypothetical protein LP419_02095 [Massilia sp. H-1]|nr:hypothetical protein LP419_02095 [Massilia sp. H-1]